MSQRAFACLIAAALGVALAFRFAGPDLRPVHHDEANQGVRFGLLLETGEYRYDRHDHHGPTLYYLTLPVAWARGQATLASLDERTLRFVPAVFGVGVILLFLLLTRGFGRAAIAVSAWLAALSPALTYYSRFYIQESVFVFLSLAFVIALGRYAQRPRTTSAVLAGACAGLAYATKETSVIVLAAGGAASLLALRWTMAGEPRTDRRAGPARLAAHAVLALAVALAVAAALYTSFFTHPSGFMESIRAYGVYVQRGVGGGPHAQPWFHYLALLWGTSSGGLVWTEALVLVLAGGGLVAAAWGLNGGFWPRYVGLYSLFCLLAFSVIRYKTPWNLLPFYVGLVLMAGNGAAVVAAGARSRTLRRIFVIVLAAGCWHLGVQSWRANFRYGADARNPYAYVHTVPDLLRLVQRVKDVAAVHPDRSRMLVKVVAGTSEQWPLPWYLRGMRRVGYWNRAVDAGALEGVPVIIASQDQTAAIDAALGDRYVSEFYGLRPGVLLSAYIERTLWDSFLASRNSR